MPHNHWNALLLLLFLQSACTVTTYAQVTPRQEDNLIVAIGEGDSTAVARLIEKGVSVNAIDSSGWTPLTYASSQGRTNIVRLLLEAGADVNGREDRTYKSTPLMLATAHNSTAIATLLIAHRADVDAIDAFGDPALNWAAYYGHDDYVQLLLDHGADAHQPSKHSDNTLGVALKEWKQTVVDVLIAHGEGEKLSPEVQTFVDAIRNGEEEQVSQLLRAGANPDQRDEAGLPVLTVAATRGFDEVVYNLLDAGADIDLLNAVGQSALTQAVFYGHQTIVDKLLAAGALVNHTDERFKLTPLMAASRAGHPVLAQQLIDAGSDLEAADGINGYTPLIWATVHDHADVVRVLIDAGANVRHVTAYDFTALDIASDTIRAMLDATATSPLVGVWQLEETTAYNQEGELVYDPEVQTGLFVFTDGHYSIMWTRNPRPPAAQHWNATDEERLTSFNTMIAHAGRYTHTDTTLRVFAEVAKSPEFVGGSETFSYRVEGDTLHLTALDAESVEGIHVAFYEAGGRQEYRLSRVAGEVGVGK